MTIKELERRTGLPRTSIGSTSRRTAHPERRENNFRDYSEDNVRTLEKIKLLRRRAWTWTIAASGAGSCPWGRPSPGRLWPWRTGPTWAVRPGV